MTTSAPVSLVALLDAPQRGQAFADQVLVRREGVVGQGFPVREQGTTQIGREKRHLLDQALRVGGVGGDDGGESACGFFPLGQAGQQQGVGRAGGAGQRVALAGGEFGKFHEDGKTKAPPAGIGGGC